AGSLTKTGHIGYVAAHPTPEVIRHINAFALGVKEVNPEAKVYVLWIHAWYDPTKARELAETLINKYSCDVLAFTEDTPTVVEVCQEYYEKGRPVYAFAHYSPMLKYGPDVCVSGQLVHWEVIYADILMKIKLGIYTNTNLENVDYWWMLREGAVELGCDYGVPINPKFIPVLKNIIVEKEIMLPNGTVVKNPSVYDLVFIRLAQMMEESPTFDPFTGPIYDQQGNLRVPPGERLGHDALWTMDWFVDNVVGEIPKGGGA
ncbi:MAG: BMP family ABC transporter substrate-binding protein, partial [Thermoprotei archaeon]